MLTLIMCRLLGKLAQRGFAVRRVVKQYNQAQYWWRPWANCTQRLWVICSNSTYICNTLNPYLIIKMQLRFINSIRLSIQWWAFLEACYSRRLLYIHVYCSLKLLPVCVVTDYCNVMQHNTTFNGTMQQTQCSTQHNASHMQCNI